ncbi:ABC transporter ATP-binding protein [Neobacillus notoginsengisoli]|uniref:ABC transporter ATP-binding protein n=1 Tax=Neobacillus notoginsengisoli TaxID=1578198 RepID=A0A417YIK2_9BACI|nr:ABC transporter ATP-binding protein [Neobacillus notoginsengisoli]RHW32822.1 ABC transporter ATP-binding protein [Neobacillus notoginsengisoli]
MKPILNTNGLVHEYKGGVVALKGIDLTIYDNDLISIIGQNGSGKSTLVKHFNGLLKPTEGTVTIDGESTTGKSVGYLSRKVGYVFQNPNHQFFSKTVKEELMVGPKNFKLSSEMAKERIDYVVDLLQINDILNDHPMTLDYTSKKIVSIASVLTSAPKIVIMDEPTGGLDEPGRQLLRKTIKLLHEQGHTVIIISHDMDFVAENTERVIVMAKGQILIDSNCEGAFRESEVLEKAWIEPPQITLLGKELGFDNEIILNVPDFVAKFKNQKVNHIF